MTTYVVTLNYSHFVWWCEKFEHCNPQSQGYVYVSTTRLDTVNKLRGREWKDGDRLVFYGPYYKGRHYSDVWQGLRLIRVPVDTVGEYVGD